jgi:hypothetical protein
VTIAELGPIVPIVAGRSLVAAIAELRPIVSPRAISVRRLALGVRLVAARTLA